jgi:hypothetical protein
MQYELSYTLSKDIVDKAIQKLLFYQGFGIKIWIGVTATLLPLISLIITLFPHPGKSMALVVAVVFLALPASGFFGMIYFYATYQHRLYRDYNRMNSKVITYQFTEDAITSRSELGVIETPWRTVDKIRCFPDIWLFILAGGGYIYLSADHISRELQTFILKQAQMYRITLSL